MGILRQVPTIESVRKLLCSKYGEKHLMKNGAGQGNNKSDTAIGIKATYGFLA